MTKPLLLIDVDGPLNPYANSNNQLRKGKEFHRYKLLSFTVWLSRWHGEELNKLADRFELTWCTTWDHSANSLISPRIGLPKLPVIEWDYNRRPRSDRMPDGSYWKTPQVVEYTAGRPFAWVDDEISDYDDTYVAKHHPGPAKLMKIAPRYGLMADHFEALADWAATLATVEETCPKN